MGDRSIDQVVLNLDSGGIETEFDRLWHVAFDCHRVVQHLGSWRVPDDDGRIGLSGPLRAVQPGRHHDHVVSNDAARMIFRPVGIEAKGDCAARVDEHVGFDGGVGGAVPHQHCGR